MARSRYLPIPLTYSSPESDTPGLAIGHSRYYNAFPELNGRAGDGWHVALPRRAKYNLPLDSELIPTGKELRARDADERVLGQLKPEVADWIRALFAREPKAMTLVPRIPQIEPTFNLHNDFELAHKRLAATTEKWRFRDSMLAPFYTLLEQAIVSAQPIKVPLRPHPAGTQLQQYWERILKWFEATRIKDEAVSLLVCVILSDESDICDREKAWKIAQDGELRDEGLPGFMPLYDSLRARYRREDCGSREERAALAEAALQDAKRALFGGASVDQPDASALPTGLSSDGAAGYCRLPDLADLEGPREFLARRALLTGAATPPSVPEVVQRVLAREALEADTGAGFHDNYTSWRVYVDFSINHIGAMTYIFGKGNHNLRGAAARGLANRSGSRIGVTAERSLALYTVFLEAMRQQICMGVGLRCPYWDGSGCCRMFPRLLAQIWRATTAGSARRGRYWCPPSCLD